MSRPTSANDLYAMTYREIAEELGMPERTVQSIARKALAKLRKQLELEGISPEAIFC